MRLPISPAKGNSEYIYTILIPEASYKRQHRYPAAICEQYVKNKTPPQAFLVLASVDKVG